MICFFFKFSYLYVHILMSRLRFIFMSRLFCLSRFFEFSAVSIKLSELILHIVFATKAHISLKEDGRFLVLQYLRGGTWYKREWNQYQV